MGSEDPIREARIADIREDIRLKRYATMWEVVPWLVDEIEALVGEAAAKDAEVAQYRAWLEPFDGGDPSDWIEGYKEMEEEAAAKDKQIERTLLVLYHRAPVVAAQLCDEELDPSGRLLDEIRAKHSALVAGVSPAQPAEDDSHEVATGWKAPAPAQPAEEQRMFLGNNAALVQFYKDDPVACARLCDEIIDPSGALLYRVRDQARGGASSGGENR